MTTENYGAPFVVVGIEWDGSTTTLGEYSTSGEAREFLCHYVFSEDAGGWDEVQVLDTRDECAETLWRWERGAA